MDIIKDVTKFSYSTQSRLPRRVFFKSFIRCDVSFGNFYQNDSRFVHDAVEKILAEFTRLMILFAVINVS